jgi:hypothetical protein
MRESSASCGPIRDFPLALIDHRQRGGQTGNSLAADRQRLAAFTCRSKQNMVQTAIGTAFADLSRRN